MKATISILITYLILMSSQTFAHDDNGEATYLGNEGVMVEHDDAKLLFDPFFHNDYGRFQLVPDDIMQKIFNNEAPYEDISAIFISHAHGDHFDANDVIKYLSRFPKVMLIGPQQAIDQILVIPQSEAVKTQLHVVPAKFEGDVVTLKLNNLVVEAVFLPHAGWPRTKEVENLAYRVTLNNEVTVLHMGDADQTDDFIGFYHEHWQQKITDTAFPPYWFLTSAQGVTTLQTHLNAQQWVGVHVPIELPDALKLSGQDYFAQPGEISSLKPHHH